MEGLEQKFVLFSANDFYFLLPLVSVKSVANGEEQKEGAPALDFVYLTGGEAADMRTYQLVLQDGDKVLILKVDGVHGIEEIGEEQIMILPKALQNEDNQFLSAVVPMESADKGEYPAYIVDSRVLYEMAE